MVAALTVDDILDAARLADLDDLSSSDLPAALSGFGWEAVPMTEGGADFVFETENAEGFIARRGNTLSIVFAGTSGPRDLLSDIRGGLTSWDTYYARYADFIDRANDVLNSPAFVGIDKVIIAGHSLGGAMAELLISNSLSNEKIVGVTFGSPGIEADIDSLGPERLFRVEHTDDLVVDFAEEVIGWPGRNDEIQWQVERPEDGSLAEHYMDKYLHTIETIFTADQAETYFRFIVEKNEFIRGWWVAERNRSDLIDLSLDNYLTFVADGNDTVNGTSGNDYPVGGAGSDSIFGFGGDDVLLGEGEGDRLHGGTGNDLLMGGVGNDTLLGQADADSIFDGSGGDSAYGGDGDDFIATGSGRDVLFGGTGFDYLSFAATYDELDPAERGVSLNFQTGVFIDCWGFRDVVGTDFEEFQDSTGDDFFFGNNLHDENWTLGKGADKVRGGGGWDFVEYDLRDSLEGAHGIDADLSIGIVIDQFGNTDRLLDVDGIRGTVFGDVLRGSAADDTFVGRAGRDSFFGGSGGVDKIAFWDEAATGIRIDLSLTSGQVVDDGHGNTETAVGFENVDGWVRDDTILGSEADNHFRGFEGADRLSGLAGDDNLEGAGGVDLLYGGNQDDHFLGGNDGDFLFGGRGDDILYGGEGIDRLTGGADRDQFHLAESEPGADIFTDFVSGTDSILGASIGTPGFTDQMLATQVLISGSATNASTVAHRFVYNTSTGRLYLDADGVGGNESRHIATLSGAPALQAGDIWWDFP